MVFLKLPPAIYMLFQRNNREKKKADYNKIEQCLNESVLSAFVEKKPACPQAC